MENNQYNQWRYNRKKQGYRIRLGIQQLIKYPIINAIWLLVGVGINILVIAKQVLLSNLNIYPMLEPVFNGCLQFIIIFFPVICAIGIMQLIGEITAIKDEADLNLVFGDRRDINNQSSILIYKKIMRKKGVTVREFYTTIPMERWQEKKEAICDRMDIHIIGEIEYGGKNSNKGNRIVIKSARGRKPMERGVLYDDIF